MWILVIMVTVYSPYIRVPSKTITAQVFNNESDCKKVQKVIQVIDPVLNLEARDVQCIQVGQ